MPGALDQWQERLVSHFSALAAERARRGFPLFALEHCLGETDVQNIAALLRGEVASGKSLGVHWLLWVIYATESGYGYSGLEFWQTFEEEIPGWQFEYRYLMAECFKKFQSTFNGYVPTGQWAGHFKLIAWPITHAILPRDLQDQFARALYDIRFRLASSDLLTVGTIGRLLAANSYHVTTRFEKFLQQEDLTGRIVLALFGEPTNESIGPIHPTTLKRIVSDLERVRATREWLHETHRTVTDRFKGLGHESVFYPNESTAEVDDIRVEEVGKIRLRPSVEFHYIGRGSWSAVMEIPDFRPLASTNVALRAFLSRTRCRISGSPDPKPARWVLSGGRRTALRSWPHPNSALIAFESEYPGLQQLLEAECRLDRGTEWLFKVGADGTARQVHSRGVRPGDSYLIASLAEIGGRNALMTPVEVDCEGVHLYLVKVPPACSESDVAILRSLKLQSAGTISVWPAGILARLWDGEGNSEWLTTDAPCFGLLNDTPVDRYGVSLDRDSEVLLDPEDPGKPVFMGLPCLPPGKHELTVKAYKRRDSAQTELTEVAAGYLVLNVRDPEPWTPGRPLHSGLIVRLDPVESTLDALWEGRVSVTVLGPESHTARIGLDLKDGQGKLLLSGEVAHAAPLPVTADEWERLLRRLTEQEANAWSYLDAVSAELLVDGSELGCHKTQFERELRPLHWATRSKSGQVFIRLVDDSGTKPVHTRVSFLSLERPRENVNLDVSALRKGIGVRAPGGLFIAEQDDHRDTIVVSTGITTAGLQGLGVVPKMGNTTIGTGSVAADLALYEDWTHARVAGHLAAIRRTKVLKLFDDAFLQMTCGPSWVRAEEAFRELPNSKDRRSALEALVHKRAGFAAEVARDYERIAQDSSGGRDWYADVASQFDVCADRFLAGFAFEFMTRPEFLRDLYGIGVDRHLRELRKYGALFRGARLAVLLCANTHQSSSMRTGTDPQ